MSDFILSPTNYSGGKGSLLSEMFELFPVEIETFYDVFGGGLNVGINVVAERVIYNDSISLMSKMFSYWKSVGVEKALDDVYTGIFYYSLSNTNDFDYKHYGVTSAEGLSSVNKLAFERLRDDFNRTKDIKLFYLLIVYSFSNNIRFDKNGNFNMPVNKRDFNSSMRKKFVSFVEKLEIMDIEFRSVDYKKLFTFGNLKDGDFLYFDPPYLGMVATYNEQGGWTGKDDLELHNLLDALTSLGVKWALSCVFVHGIFTNEPLIEWSKKYDVHRLTGGKNNANHQAKDKKSKRGEILITNY